MEIKILFNRLSDNDVLSVGWGLAFLVDNRIIFDTGEKGDFLTNNINKLKVDLSLIEAVVISHDHWDHTGGLWEILKQRGNINVYACPGFSDEFKRKAVSSNGNLVESSDFMQISKDVFVTGEIKGEYKDKYIAEQALVITTDKGLTVITGCAHPGIIKILELIRERIPNKQFYAVFGGFHLMNKLPCNFDAIVNSFKELGVKKVGPTHCSGTDAEQVFKKKYGDNFLTTKVGEILYV